MSQSMADKKVGELAGIRWIELFASLQTTCDACKPNLIHVSCLVKLKLFWLAIVWVSLALKQGKELRVAGLCAWPSQILEISVGKCFVSVALLFIS